MRRICLSVAIGSVAALVGFALAAPVSAAPPTATPTPGYDARLQEQRAASQAAESPKPAYVPRRKPKPHHSVPR